eukprot:scaffold23476_cov125-Cylindrotheca_fusiformis.AAC.14
MFLRQQIAIVVVILQAFHITHCFDVAKYGVFRISSLRSSTSVDDQTYIRNSFEQKLLDRLRRNDTTSPIVAEGYVIAKRSLGKHLVFVDFEIRQDGKPDLCQAMIRKEYFTGEGLGGYRRCLLKGTKLKVVGTASPTRNPGNSVLLLQSIELLGLPRQSQHIHIILNQCMEGMIPMDEVANACNVEKSILVEKLNHIRNSRSNVNDPTDAGTRKAMNTFSKEILFDLPNDPTYPVGVDQKLLSKKGNFLVPEAPKGWLKVPRFVKQKTPPTRRIRKETVQEVLALPFQEEDTISFSGWVQNRRRFTGNITVIALVDNLIPLSEDSSDVLNIDTDRISCLLHPRLTDRADLYQNLLSVGAKVQVEGRLLHDTSLGETILWIHHINLIRSSSRSATIRGLLDMMAERKIDSEEAADALMMPYSEALYVSHTMDATDLQWKANQLAVRLQEASKSRRSRVVSPELLFIMEKYRHCAEMHPPIMTCTLAETALTAARFKIPNAIKAIPMGVPGSNWMAKKKPQLEWMGQQIRSVLASHPDFGKRKLNILDIGGGKGSLANYLGQAMDDVYVHVVDICAGAVANGEAKARRLELPVNFQLADASSSDLDVIKADVVVALHACGHLSDIALAHAVNRDAGFVIVPCCFNSNPHLTIPGPNKTAVHDWLGLPESDWNVLKLLAEVQGDIPFANEAIGILCAVRAEAARSRMLQRGTLKGGKVEIRQFPIEYSTRNTVLVGTCDGRRLSD